MGAPAAAAGAPSTSGDEPRLPVPGGNTVLICLFLTAYLLLNIGLNFYNNWLLSPLPPPMPGGLGFPSALLYTMCHMVAGVFGSSLLMTLRPELGQISWAQFLGDRGKLMSLSLLFCAGVGTSNLSLAHLGLSINQVIKSATVLFVVIFAYVLERKTFSLQKLACVMLIVGGVVLSIPYGTSNAEPEGVILCLISVAVAGLKISLGSLLMQGKNSFTPMVLVWYESFFSIFYLAFAALALGEPAKLAVYAEADEQHMRISIFAVIAGALMAFVYNFVSFKFLQLTSSVTHSVTGNIKLFALVVMPAIFVDHVTGLLSWIGFSLFLFATLAYTYVSWSEGAQGRAKDAAAARATAPAEGDSTKEVLDERTPLIKNR